MVSRSGVRAWLLQRRIGVLMGGESAEREISLKTGDAVLKSLQRQGFKAQAIDAKIDELPKQLRAKKIDAAYIALHGPGGEDGRVQGLLESLKIPYTGSGVLASALAMDKIASKLLFDAAGLSSPRWTAVTPFTPGIAWEAKKLGYPLVVKPARQGSALGVSIVRKPGELAAALKKAFQLDADVLIEKFFAGPEITVGILGSQTLPIIEIVPTDRSFYDFHAKYAPGGSRHLLPARISARAAEEAKELSLSACRALNIRAVARVDLIVGPRDRPVLLEVNTIPGMTETSLLPDAAAAAGIPFDSLVMKIAEYSFGA